MYRLRSQQAEQVVLGQSRKEYLGAGLFVLLSLAGLAQAWRMMPHGHYSVLGAASLLVLAAGLLLFLRRHGQASELIFNNQLQALFFRHHHHPPVPIVYQRIKTFEVCHLSMGNQKVWVLGTLFCDGTFLPLLQGKKKHLQRQLQNFKQWIQLHAAPPEQKPSLPPLPSWLNWQENGSRLRCSWKSRLSWTKILLSTAFILGFALICYRAADPAELPDFWLFCTFSAVLTSSALVLMAHGIMTRERSNWLIWDASSLHWGVQGFGSSKQRQLGMLNQAQPLKFYCSFAEPKLTAVNAQGEQDLRRKIRLNPTYALQRVLQMVKGNLRLEMELTGFRQDEVLLLQEHLIAWGARQQIIEAQAELQPEPLLEPDHKHIQ